MNLHLSGHHLEVTPAIRDYVISKLSRISRHFDHLIEVNVILSVIKLEQKVEATIRLPGKDIFALAQAPDMYAAIDLLADKLDRQVRKHKERNNSGQRPERAVKRIPGE